MKIVFMGTPEFAVPSLEKLLAAGHEVSLVVTQPDRRGNRGKMTCSAVKNAAVAHGLPVAQPERIRSDEAFVSELTALQPDLIVVVAFGQILPQRVLDIPKLGCLNVHGSLLPLLRGAAPMQYAILEGLATTGVTIMQMDAGLDTGDMLAKAETEIGRKDIEELAEELSLQGADLLAETVVALEKGALQAEKQDEARATYAPTIRKSDGETDFHRSAIEEDRRIRAYKGWPTAFSRLDGKTVKFFAAEPLADRAADGEPGTIQEVFKDSFIVNCGEGCLRILELQLQGKKRLGAEEFLRGVKLAPGMRFSL